MVSKQLNLYKDLNYKNAKILFDTGSENIVELKPSSQWAFEYNRKDDEPSYLTENLKKLGLTVLDIDKIVLSHNHWDHAGELESIILNHSMLQKKHGEKKLDLYIPSTERIHKIRRMIKKEVKDKSFVLFQSKTRFHHLAKENKSLNIYEVPSDITLIDKGIFSTGELFPSEESESTDVHVMEQSLILKEGNDVIVKHERKSFLH